VVCSNCGTEAIPGSKFCAKCGTRLSLACPACGFAIDASDTFCRDCGAPLGPAAAAPPAGSPGSGGAQTSSPAGASSPVEGVVELRVVSVLFADLVGFTRLSESRDAEEVRDLLSRYFDVCRALVERYGGTVEKFIGDAVMAVWGAPVAQEDDAERAVRAALDLVEAVAALGEDVRAPELAARAGLGRVLTLQGRYDEAAPLLEEALRLAEHLELPEVYSQGLSSKAVYLMDSDRLDEAGLLLGRALEVALEHGLTAAAMRAYNNLGVVLEAQDRFSELVIHNEKRYELARRVGDRVMELSSLVAPISELLALGRWDEVLARAQEARAAEELEGLDWVAFTLVSVASLYARRGDLEEASRLIESMRASGTSESWERRTGYALARSEVLRAEGRLAEALAAAEEVLFDRAELGLGFTDFRVKNAMARAVEAALDLGDLSKAKELLGIAQAALPGQVTPWLRAQLARLSARERAAEGDHGAVEASFEAGESGFRELATSFDLAVTLTEHAEWLTERGRPDRARPLRAEAREIFDGLGARPWLERVGPATEEESVSA
jgi:pentatricopeptide repeat protein